jgi:hypothetical protein
MMRTFILAGALLLHLAAISLANTIVVGTIAELTSATTALTPGDTLFLRDGTYIILSYAIAVRTDRVVIGALSGDRERVVVTGAGMNGEIDHGFWISANNVTIRDMTIQNVRYHCIQTDVNTDSLRVINCILRDGGEQLLKVPFNASEASPSEAGLVEGCLFDFSGGIAARGYTGGIDCHFAKNWIVRNNVFKYIRSPEDAPAEHAIHFWTNSENTLVENNVVIDCDRGIGFGLGDVPHKGGIIRNNMIYHRAIGGNDRADAGITLETCANARVYNNTIYFENDYPNAIEYRFAATAGVVIANNLTNKAIRARDGATGALSANVTTAQASWFRSLSTGDLHLSSGSIASAIDQGIAMDELTHDIDGDIRPRGSGIDIGADEYSDAGVLMPSMARPAKSPEPVHWIITRSHGRSRVFAGRESRDLAGRCIRYTGNDWGVYFKKGK